MKTIQKKPAKKRASWNVDISFGKVKDTDLLFFTRNLALSIKSGLTFFDALTMLTDQANGKLKIVLKKIIPIVQSGQPFYLAISAYPQHFLLFILIWLKPVSFREHLKTIFIT